MLAEYFVADSRLKKKKIWVLKFKSSRKGKLLSVHATSSLSTHWDRLRNIAGIQGVSENKTFDQVGRPVKIKPEGLWNAACLEWQVCCLPFLKALLG